MMLAVTMAARATLRMIFLRTAGFEHLSREVSVRIRALAIHFSRICSEDGLSSAISGIPKVLALGSQTCTHYAGWFAIPVGGDHVGRFRVPGLCRRNRRLPALRDARPPAR